MLSFRLDLCLVLSSGCGIVLEGEWRSGARISSMDLESVWVVVLLRR